MRKPVLEDLDMFKAQHTDKSAICLESAILLTNDFRLHVDAVLLVSADMDTKIKRIKERDPFRSDKEIDMLYQNQLSEDDMLKVCQYVIVNVNKTSDQLMSELKVILKEFILS
jgi:dephospho-CoA kinase